MDIITDEEYYNIKTPLSYQLSEYDCGQATLFNAIRFLYTRGEIPPIILKIITENSLDTQSSNGEIGKGGTSPQAIEKIANWINNSPKELNMNLNCTILKDNEVNINNTKFIECVKNGGVAILRVWQECEHYVLCTGIEDEYLYVFDPYYLEDDTYDDDPKVIMITNKPFEYNRIVSKKRFEEDSKEDFSLVKDMNKQIVLFERK